MFATIAFVLALALGPFVAFRAYARRVEATDAPVEDRLHRLRRVQQAGGFVLPIAAVIGLHFLELIGRPNAVVGSAGPELFGIDVLEFVAITVVSFGVATLPLLSMALGTYPAVSSLRDTSASAWRIVKGVLAAMAAVAVTVAVSIGGLLALVSTVGSSLSVLVGGFAVLIAASYGLSPYLIAVFQDRVPLEGADRERVERLCTELGYRPRSLYLFEGGSTKTANALVAGTVPGFRYVFLTDYLLEACDDDELRAILAHEFGHVAGRHLWQRGLLAVAVFGGWTVAVEILGVGILEDRFGFLGIFLPLMAVFGLYQVVFLGGLARWQEFRADAYAARRAGRDATIAALETLADANDTRRDAGLLYSLATQHPPIDDRLEAIRDGSDGADRSPVTPTE
ncbi:peptidase M48 Ste24p [Haloterrigena turkmenica DSM 5511]|uniref:Peptidase M48 Ste24p n=1 Tax=Haloterrigena turkmenica (strain ATCC 51198 / DSM 5511 / JCM 9101 / NCIMB 13204 / VKM B-1734 / 4k) TaxID=543526 RepID=D2RXV1_HALTV|nr:M48 family metalloprotease [Haloterrigena turkmenica]ADB59785.1 peptidase M48 Ste24p [Haloterrigena turkmenica DSM 5511]